LERRGGFKKSLYEPSGQGIFPISGKRYFALCALGENEQKLCSQEAIQNVHARDAPIGILDVFAEKRL